MYVCIYNSLEEMVISKLLVFLIGIYFSSGKIDTIDVDNNDLAFGKLFIIFFVHSYDFPSTSDAF